MSGLGTKKFCFCILRKVLEPIAIQHNKNLDITKEIIDILIKNNACTIDDVLNQLDEYEADTKKGVVVVLRNKK